MDLKSIILDLPEAVQYIAVLGIVMLILYVCLTLTRIFGRNRGEKINYDDPQAYDESVPDIFASTWFKRKPKGAEDDGEKKDGAAD